MRWRNRGGVDATKKSMISDTADAAKDPRVQQAAFNAARTAAQDPQVRQAAMNAAANSVDGFV